jgi:anti-sigma B factor antagonist
MQIDVNYEDGIHIAVLDGLLDENAREAFEEQLHLLVIERGNRVILDLSAVPRVTSSGLGLLVTLMARANTKGASLVLAAPTPFVESVIGVTRLDQFFVMAPSVERAAQSIT